MAQSVIDRYSFLDIISEKYIKTFPAIKASELYSNTDIFLKLNYGQRIDTLAYQYLGSGNYWWVICLINNLRTPFDKGLIVGKLLRIPISINRIITVLENKSI